MSVGTVRAKDPRIRILSCEPPPPPRRRINWRLVSAAGAIAVTMVGSAWLLRGDAEPQQFPAAPPAAVIDAPVEAHGVIEAGSFRTTARVAHAMDRATVADLPAAAKFAASREIPAQTAGTSTALAPVGTTGSSPMAPQSTTQVPASGGTGSAGDRSTDSAPATSGPHLAPGPGDPISPEG